MKKQGQRLSIGGDKTSLKMPPSFTASRQKLTSPPHDSAKNAKIGGMNTGQQQSSASNIKTHSSLTNNASNRPTTATISHPKPIDSRLSIQTPKTQFVSKTVSNYPNAPQTQTHQSQQKNSFNFNFNKMNQKIQHFTEKSNIPSNAPTPSQQQSQLQASDSGYKSFIQIANKKDQHSRTANTSPIVKSHIQQQPPQNLDSQIPNTNFSSKVHQIPQSQQIMPSQSVKVSPVRNISPGERIVIKKSEINFKPSPPRENNVQQQLGSSIKLDNKRDSTSNSPQKKDQEQRPSDILAQGKQLAFDFIKSMLHIGGNSQNNAKPNEQKDENYSSGGVLKKKFMKFGSPGPNHQTLKKQNINFVHDMKKHGIIKDIDSVKAMRFYLENSPNPSENNSLIDQSIQNSPLDNPVLNSSNNIDPTINHQNQQLQIETAFKDPNLLEADKKVSPTNDNNYIFPFQRRARSYSPPKDSSLGQNNSQHSQGSINNESPPGGISIHHFKMPQDKSLQSKQQQQMSGQISFKNHQRMNSGPIIPDRNCIENVIKATPGIFFGMGPHLGNHMELKNEEIDQKILKGKEVDEWLNFEDGADNTKQTKDEKIKSRFSELGFIGDADDVDDDEIIEKEDSDEWMFQTFEKKNNMPQVPVVQRLNQGQYAKIDPLDQDEIVLPEDDLLEDLNPSINQGGNESAGLGYTNMLDKWLNKMQ